MDQKIFAFGGVDRGEPILSAEVYDVEANLWKKLPDMPRGGLDIT